MTDKKAAEVLKDLKRMTSEDLANIELLVGKESRPYKRMLDVYEAYTIAIDAILGRKTQ